MNVAGPREDPCTTPALKDLRLDVTLSRFVQCDLSERKLITQLYTCSGNSISSSLADREACRKVHVVNLRRV